MVPLMRSFVMPMIIMAAVPLGLIGVLTMLWATKTTLNVQSEMGVIFLVGIIVSQGVLLIDFANQLRKQGKSWTVVASELHCSVGVARLRAAEPAGSSR